MSIHRGCYKPDILIQRELCAEIILSVMYLSHPSTELHTAPLCYLLSVTECLTCGWAGIGGFADDTKPQRFVLVFYVSACLHGVLFFAAHPTLLPKGH